MPTADSYVRRNTQSYRAPKNIKPPTVSRDTYRGTTGSGINWSNGSGQLQVTGLSDSPVGSYGGDYGGDSGGSYGGAPAAPPMSEADWLAGDQSYIRQMAALKAALDNFIADQGAQTTRYNTDFNDGIRQLGWSGRPAAEGSNPWDSAGGSWNETDLNTASGRAFTNQLNDFASRGLLQSSLFGTARNDLSRSLNDQLSSVVTGRRNFLDDLARQRTSYTQENENSGRSAREEALARMAASIGL